MGFMGLSFSELSDKQESWEIPLRILGEYWVDCLQDSEKNASQDSRVIPLKSGSPFQSSGILR